ncbi:HpcH/HpaI aldolase/citrate lyase family protein [Actinocorallia sp. A-T 12471]|uniref:HpcH/HpaI aldolase/citrate lyase family protein n=1 Tax=Actinocorallia sp. A-T 12471 TaxID=3089813 RepID=UPI0029D271CD|nr:HpcH/HpaI aldolase/citrate lyase family protein [Actinocorallia sp. A-T 12471]MDX6744706.1 HpcH/HpaI aldolase/citrate lyase family protein [Actinocorallia sp. A-T 12471]
MRHFHQIDAGRRAELFHRQPRDFGRDSDPGLLAVALGATLYSPATRPRLAADIAKRAALGVRSMVVCLEDSISDRDVPAAEDNLVAQLAEIDPDAAPLLFVRVRTPEQIPDLVRRLGRSAELLSGFVLPKFEAVGGKPFLDALGEASGASGVRLLAMPVIETRDALYRETRTAVLTDIARLLDERREQVLAVRLGGTDLCAAYGLRRPRELTIYDLHLVASLIADVVNVFGRADGTGFVVTGPVWEYFSAGERLFKPQLREAPFVEHSAEMLRKQLITDSLDGFIREVTLDQANGLTGKTVIHPSHVAAVHALSVVSHEQFADATDILGVPAGGAMASSYANKMNEAKPHRAWAERTLLRAEVFGVAAENVGFVDLFEAAVGR